MPVVNVPDRLRIDHSVQHSTQHQEKQAETIAVITRGIRELGIDETNVADLLLREQEQIGYRMQNSQIVL